MQDDTLFGDEKNSYKDLTMQQDLKMYFDEYLYETGTRNLERIALKEIKNNPADYKEMTLPEAMDAADAKLMEDPEKNRYGTHLDFNKLENWNSNNWDSINKYDAEQLKNIEEAQQNRTEQKETGLSTGLYGTLKTIGSALGGCSLYFRIPQFSAIWNIPLPFDPKEYPSM